MSCLDPYLCTQCHVGNCTINPTSRSPTRRIRPDGQLYPGSAARVLGDIDHGDRKRLIGAAAVSMLTTAWVSDRGQSITVWREVCGGEPLPVGRRVTPLARRCGHRRHRRAVVCACARQRQGALASLRPPLRGARGLDAGSAHARPDWPLTTMLAPTPPPEYGPCGRPLNTTCSTRGGHRVSSASTSCRTTPPPGRRRRRGPSAPCRHSEAPSRSRRCRNEAVRPYLYGPVRARLVQ